jgi:hypothetical protein
MIKHLKRLLGIGQAPAETPAPYKVETPVEGAGLVEVKPAAKAKPAKKPAAKAKTPRKPRAPKA